MQSSQGASRWAVELLIKEAVAYYAEDRYSDALRVAEKAVAAARGMGDLDLEIRAAHQEADALRMMGDFGTALTRFTWILAITEDPSRRRELERADVTQYIARAYMNWVECARFLPEMPTAQLFQVLDAGERYLRAVGKPGWRAGLLSQRARLLEELGRPQDALGPAEEAVALAERNPDAPGYTLATYRWYLGDLLRQIGRAEEAATHYHKVLDDRRSTPHGQFIAHEGLARCALAGEQMEEARRHAQQAMLLAEGMGDDSLCPALAVLVEACRRAGDLGAAREAAERHLQTARRLGSKIRLYHALRDRADVALDEADTALARDLLDEAAPLAEALDRQRGVSGFSQEIADRRARLPA